MKSPIRQIWFLHLCRMLLAIIFLSAALGKILDIQSFIKTLDAYRLLPDFLLSPLGHFLPWLEFMVGLSLLIDRWPSGAVLMSGLLLLLFIGIVIITLLRGIEIDCGCFSFISEDNLSKTLIRDLIFLIPTLILFRWHRYPKQESQS